MFDMGYATPGYVSAEQAVFAARTTIHRNNHYLLLQMAINIVQCIVVQFWTGRWSLHKAQSCNLPYICSIHVALRIPVCTSIQQKLKMNRN